MANAGGAASDRGGTGAFTSSSRGAKHTPPDWVVYQTGYPTYDEDHGQVLESTVVKICKTQKEAAAEVAKLQKLDTGWRNYRMIDDRGGRPGYDPDYIAAKRDVFTVGVEIVPDFAELGAFPFQVMSLDGTVYTLELQSKPPDETIDLTELLVEQNDDKLKLGTFDLYVVNDDEGKPKENVNKIVFDENTYAHELEVVKLVNATRAKKNLNLKLVYKEPSHAFADMAIAIDEIDAPVAKISTQIRTMRTLIAK